MSRAVVVLCVAAGLSVAAFLGGCGASRARTTTATHLARTDAALAQRVLSAQLALLHRALPGRWRQTGAASDAVCGGAYDARAGLTGRAVSAGFVYGRIELRVGSYVFASSIAASRALSAFAARALQVCLAQSLVAELRNRYVTDAPRGYTNAIVHLGQGARAIRIIVPSRYEGRPFTWNLDETAVRQGRLVAVLATLAGASTARYNHALAAGLANVANREQHRP